MAKNESVTMNRIVDIVILVAGWEGDVIYNVGRNPVFNWRTRESGIEGAQNLGRSFEASKKKGAKNWR